MNSTDVSMGDYGERLGRIEVTLGEHGERLSRIEPTLAHTATSAELQKVIAEMQKLTQKIITEVSVLKWLLATVATAVLYAAAKYTVS